MEIIGIESIYSSYLVTETSLYFSIFLRIDKLVQLIIYAVKMQETNEHCVPYILINVNDRKYTGDSSSQSYGLYFMDNDKYACAYNHVSKWISMYRRVIEREVLH